MGDQPLSSYIWPGETHFGLGASQLAGHEASRHGARHAFLLGDEGVAGAGLLQPALDSLEAAGVTADVYLDIPSNPDYAAVDAAAAACRAQDCDVIVALGGGSVLDAAKGVRLLAAAPAGVSVGEYGLVPGVPRRPAPDLRQLPPLLAIPTTAGTGSEVTPWGVFTDLERGRKVAVGGAYLVPSQALVDPELTCTLPPRLTAATGVDALAHCVEAYVSTRHNPLLDPMILYGVELIGRSLRRAVARPDDRDARAEVMLAALVGGIAISSKWLGACHSLAHQLSSQAGLHHGEAIALMLPHQMAFSLGAAAERYARIAVALNGGATTDAEKAVDAVGALIADVGLPARLRDAGVGRELLPTLAEKAYEDLNWSTNPCPVTQEDMAHMYEQAY